MEHLRVVVKINNELSNGVMKSFFDPGGVSLSRFDCKGIIQVKTWKRPEQPSSPHETFQIKFKAKQIKNIKMLAYLHK